MCAEVRELVRVCIVVRGMHRFVRPCKNVTRRAPALACVSMSEHVQVCAGMLSVHGCAQECMGVHWRFSAWMRHVLKMFLNPGS